MGHPKHRAGTFYVHLKVLLHMNGSKGASTANTKSHQAVSEVFDKDPATSPRATSILELTP